MPRREPELLLRHMLAHAREAVLMCSGRVRQDLDADRKLNLALVRLLEIVGEAAAQIPAADKARFPEIPWREMTGLRNRLIHGYDAVDFDIVWEIVTRDLPELITALEKSMN